MMQQQHQEQLWGKFPGSSTKRREERIAKDSRYSYKTLNKLEEIVEYAEQNPEQSPISIVSQPNLVRILSIINFLASSYMPFIGFHN